MTTYCCCVCGDQATHVCEVTELGKPSSCYLCDTHAGEHKCTTGELRSLFDEPSPSKFERALEFIRQAEGYFGDGYDVLADDAIDCAINALNEARP